jgi:opacity protein-like surface antigen
MIKVLLLATAFVILTNVSLVNAQVPGEQPRERLGARVSFTGTVGALNEHFGTGYDFTLYFTERLSRSWYLEVRIGATYMGDLNKPEIAEQRTRIEGISSEMRLAYLSLGPQYTWVTSETQTLYGTLGIGIYSVSMLYDTGVQAFKENNQNFGMNGGVGFLWRITTNWNIELNTTVQHLRTDIGDLYYIFTSSGQNPWLFSVGFGVAMDLR